MNKLNFETFSLLAELRYTWVYLLVSLLNDKILLLFLQIT